MKTLLLLKEVFTFIQDQLRTTFVFIYILRNETNVFTHRQCKEALLHLLHRHCNDNHFCIDKIKA